MEAVVLIYQGPPFELIGMYPNCGKAAEYLANEIEPMAFDWTLTSVETKKELPIMDVVQSEGYATLKDFLATYFEDCLTQKVCGLWDRYDLGFMVWRYFINE